MGTYTANWEDDENNRIVELAVDYRVDGSEVEIQRITPKTVRFVEGNPSAGRKIGVHTEAGRTLLERRYREHFGLERLEQEVLSNRAVASN